jgi:microcystin-dependent protein
VDPFVAEIRIFPFNFAPRGWAWCDGQLLPLSQNTALFSLLGTTYGGDGKATFALPDLQGRSPMHPGQGPGLSLYDLGQTGGIPAVTLLESELPVHSHAFNTTAGFPGEERIPTDRSFARTAGVGGELYGPVANLASMAPQALPPAGAGLPHNNMMPFLTFYFCIALQGVFPPRS